MLQLHYTRKNKKLLFINEELDFLEAYSNGFSKSMESEIITALDYKEALSLISSLPYDKKTVFILKHFYNYKYEEISEILDVPIGTVRSRLHNTIKVLIKQLKERGVIDEG